MKKLLYILILGLFTVSLQGQFINTRPVYAIQGSAGVDYCDEYDAVLAAFGTAPHDTIKAHQNALVDSLATNGYWARMGVFCVYASHDSVDGIINWTNPGTFNSDLQGGLNWTEFYGLTANGSSGYISTNFTPGSDSTAGNFFNNDCTVGVYLQEASNTGYVLSCYEATQRIFYRASDGTNSSYYINSNTNNGKNNTTSNGCHIITRTAPKADALYINSSTAFDSGTTESVALPNVELTLLAKIQGTQVFGTNTVAIFFIMDGINATEAGEIIGFLEDYMDDIGNGLP